MGVPRGLPGTRNPPDVLAVVRGDADTASRTYVTGAFNLYTYRGARFDVGSPHSWTGSGTKAFLTTFHGSMASSSSW
ncbi:MAG TPA: hypothetical protein VL119_05955 [Acidimicrobiia bacterium]|nr:hypothetical protein [Acidimicrobiia bacterium]